MSDTYLKSEFKNWMEMQKKSDGNSYSSNTINSYITALKNASAKLQIDGIEKSDLFYYTTAEDFDAVHDILVSAPNFNEVDLAAGNKAYSCGMVLYERFLEEYRSPIVGSNGKISKASFLQWFKPLITALKELGGSATPEEARQKIIEICSLTDDVINAKRGKNEAKKFDNEVAWARNYLTYEGMLDKSERGVWTLTQKGKETDMTHDLASQIFFQMGRYLKRASQSEE